MGATPGYGTGADMAKTRGKRAWVWDSGVGRWRLDGRWAKRPPRSALRKDRAGRPIDARGRRVPLRALAPARGSAPRTKLPKKKPPSPPKRQKGRPPSSSRSAPKTPKYAPIEKYFEPPKYVWDGERWRSGGKFVKPPLARELYFDDETGHYLDAKGNRVPSRYLQEVPKRDAHAPQRASVERLQDGEIFPGHMIRSEYVNRKLPENLSEIFSKLISAHARKGPFSPDDVVIYQHGVKFVGPEKLDKITLAALRALAPADSSIKYIDTHRTGTDVYVFLGKGAPKLLQDVELSLTIHSEAIQAMYLELLDYWGSIDHWDVWGEVEESLYD